jgi:hypothetical protein
MSNNIKTVVYIIERLSENNITDLEILYKAVYSKALPVNYFHNKYDTAFTTVQYTGYIAYDNQLPVAFYGVIPCFIRFNDKTILAAQSADTMTHPLHRTKRTFELCREYNIQLLFGFPNQNSIYGFINKLGWTTHERMDCFIIRAGTFSWQRILRKLSFLHSWYKNYHRHQLKKYLLPQKGINNSVFTDNYAGLLRDADYLNYKKYATTHVIKLGSSVLWIKINNELLIGDISVLPKDFAKMIYKLKKLTRKLGIKEIHFHVSPNTTLHALFADRFKAIPSFPLIFKQLNGNMDTGQIKFTSADIDTF